MPATFGNTPISEPSPSVSDLSVIDDLDLTSLKNEAFAQARLFTHLYHRVNGGERGVVHYFVIHFIAMLIAIWREIGDYAVSVGFEHRLKGPALITWGMFYLSVKIERFIQSRQRCQSKRRIA